MTRQQFYERQIKAWDWPQIVSDARSHLDDGEPVGMTYLGSVFTIMPSGKYYMPFACGNLDPCPHCKGHGCAVCNGCGSREAARDEDFREALEAVAAQHGGFVTAGEGSATDILFGISVEAS